jgi:hypothetical protein
MDSMSPSVSPDQLGSHGSSATNATEQLPRLALQFMLSKAKGRSSRRQDKYHCASKRLLASAITGSH